MPRQLYILYIYGAAQFIYSMILTLLYFTLPCIIRICECCLYTGHFICTTYLYTVQTYLAHVLGRQSIVAGLAGLGATQRNAMFRLGTKPRVRDWEQPFERTTLPAQAA